MERITTYLCGEILGSVVSESHGGDIEVTRVADGAANTAMWPVVSVPGCQGSAGKITTQLIKTGFSKYSQADGYCYEDGYLEWGRKLVGNSFITITINNPPHCHWIASVVVAIGANFTFYGRVLGLVYPGEGGGACPEDKDDVFSGGGITYLTESQNQMLPGELLQLTWHFSDGTNQEELVVDGDWYCTCCFTGGKVISINGSYGDPGITYTVSVQGVHKTCVSSDFVEYEVGDWVFILVPGGDCSTCRRTVPCKDGCNESSTYIILPLKIGDYGP
jgi:hypothetical protein